jgi:hypothetical protein
MVQNWIYNFASSTPPKIKQIPTDVGHWKRIVKSKYPYVENNVVVIAYLTLFILQLIILMPLKE